MEHGGQNNPTAEELKRYRAQLAEIAPASWNWNLFETWIAGIRPLLRRHFPSDIADFDKIATSPSFMRVPESSSWSEESQEQYASRAQEAEEANHEMVKTVQAKLLAFVDSLILLHGTKEPDIPGLRQVEKLLARFHMVANQLKKRHDSRDTLRITDEYDVQDLLHALLRIEFDDIRPEEHAPSFAGKSGRMGFLLKKPCIVVEVKKTRENLAAKEIGDQLLIDIPHYQAHPDCRTLVCFVYDPEQRINNPAGLKHDLESLSSERLTVVVHIAQH